MPLLAIFWPSTRYDLVSMDFLWFIRRTWEERAHGNTANMDCTKGQRQQSVGHGRGAEWHGIIHKSAVKNRKKAYLDRKEGEDSKGPMTLERDPDLGEHFGSGLRWEGLREPENSMFSAICGGERWSRGNFCRYGGAKRKLRRWEWKLLPIHGSETKLRRFLSTIHGSETKN